MATEKVEFEFPDEAEAKTSKAGGKVVTPEADEIKVETAEDDVEIVDDTPPADRNRAPMSEPPKEVTEEELAKYSDQSLKARLAHLGRGYHEERRAKEAALREREEAIRAAQAIAEENKKLKGSLSQGQSALLEQAKKVVNNELDVAKRKYKEAYEAGDSDALLAAQEDLTSARIKFDKLATFKPATVEEKPKETASEPAYEPPQRIDPRVVDWREKNNWFGNNRKMTAYAIAVHEDLVQNERVSPSSDDYFKRLDAEMRDRFPDQFESEKPEDAPSPRTKASNVVAPATRSTAPKKIVLTKSQVEIAKRLQVPLELYARKVAEQMRSQ
jgi:hypothetical protein